jgi:glyoxylase-like metal-dependent hydrolase (beta-lactamase superfamily II)
MQNFAYLVEDGEVGFLVDPAWEIPRLERLAKEHAPGVRVTHILATHGHFDHVQGVPEAKKRFGATVVAAGAAEDQDAWPRPRVVAHESADHPEVDVRVKDGEELAIGRLRVRVVHTPGHRFDSVCYLVDGTHLLTGDTLFVGECGRVDLPGSDPAAMHKSLTRTLRALPDELIVLPGHDYGKTPTSTLGEQKRTNYTMQPRTLDEFLEFMQAP